MTLFPVVFLLITGNNLEICLLPLETGPCRALISRFYYDRNQQRCRKFKYGGCLGNANNFQSRELCEHTCGNIESKWGVLGSASVCTKRRSELSKFSRSC
ncbi:Tissue factor pathway inhibitor 2 [Lemmus lemmus]